MPKLGVNIDHVATLREARRGAEPEPAYAAAIAEMAGADGITVHLREDRRHINERDVRLLRQVVKTKLNLEMSIANDIVKIALTVKPDQSTLVPEKRQEVTTEGGLDVVRGEKNIRRVVEKLKKSGIVVSLFIAPEAQQIDAAGRVGADFIELHTGRYANSKNEKELLKELNKLKESAAYAHRLGLRVNAGHGLNYQNVVPVARIPHHVEELNIGHAIISRAVFVGLAAAVREMKELIKGTVP